MGVLGDRRFFMGEVPLYTGLHPQMQLQSPNASHAGIWALRAPARRHSRLRKGEVFAYVGLPQNLKDLKVMRRLKKIHSSLITLPH